MSDTSLTIVVIDDEVAVQHNLKNLIINAFDGHAVELFAQPEEALLRITTRPHEVDVILLDDEFGGTWRGSPVLQEIRRIDSRIPVILFTQHDSLDGARSFLATDGAEWYFTKSEIFPENGTSPVPQQAVSVIIRFGAFRSRTKCLPSDVIPGSVPPYLIPISLRPNFMEVVNKVGTSNLDVLVLGPTGSGKEGVIEALARVSGRRVVGYNILETPREGNLLQLTLFGSCEGYLGHPAQEGIFEAANGGIIFLDEIADSPLDVQVSLLRILQTRTVRRLGWQTLIHGTNADIAAMRAQFTMALQRARVNAGRITDFRNEFHNGRPLPAIPLNIRVFAATSGERLRRKITNDEEFRLDLYFRLAGFVIELPPLRGSDPDFGQLVSAMVADLQQSHPGFDVDAAVRQRIESRDYPGNRRELGTVLKRMAAFAGSGVVALPLVDRFNLLAGVDDANLYVPQATIDGLCSASGRDIESFGELRKEILSEGLRKLCRDKDAKLRFVRKIAKVLLELPQLPRPTGPQIARSLELKRKGVRSLFYEEKRGQEPFL